MIELLWLSFLLFISGACCCKQKTISYLTGCTGAVLLLVIGIYSLAAVPTELKYSLPFNISIELLVDHLSAIFLIISSVSWIALALYSLDYSKRMPQQSLALGFNLCLLGMAIIMTAHDGITLLIGWEIMTIFAFVMMLIRENNYERAFRFLAFGEISTALLLIGFSVLYRDNNSVSLDVLHNGSATVLVLLSLGFIVKMDIVPFHGWMRAVYGDIPDNTAAMLSAPVTLMGVYGLERIIPVEPGNDTWSIIMVLLGAFSAFWGGMQAVAANKMRLLPAYSTVENNGMILTAIGFFGLLRTATGSTFEYLAMFAYAASLIIALSHTWSKTLLFMSIGHVKEAYNVHTIDQARGVWKGVGKVPALGIIISSLSFSAFPPLIGYVGEWMLLETLFQSYRFPTAALAFFSALAGVLTALAIGLIGFAMIKLIGYTALGFDHERKVHPIPHRLMNLTEISLETLLILCGVALPVVIIIIGYPALLTHLLAVPQPLLLASNNPPFGVISPTFIAIIMCILFIIPFLIYKRKKGTVRIVQAWNGGLTLQETGFFTALAYSQILEHILRNFYHTREITSKTRRSVEVEDILIRPTRSLTRLVHKIGEGEAFVIMNGKISAYVTYILILFVLAFLIGMIVM